MEALTGLFGEATLRQTLTDVLVTSYDIERRQPWFFRSRRACHDDDCNFELRQIVRATTAAPTFFEPARLPNLYDPEVRMLDEAQAERLIQVMPLLRSDPVLARELARSAFFARVPAGRDVFAMGERVDAIALLVSGTVRVYKMSDTGREITLYRFSGGESCILTANAIMSDAAFPAIATVEDDAEAVMVPADAFREWVGRYAPWRDFVFALLSQRLVSVMEIVDEVAFGRLDSRVAALLLREGVSEDTLRITHAEIAAELGSSREVITRMLSGFGERGLVVLRRGEIDLCDRDALGKIAAR